jgi:AraC-like DNA-binding protein
LILQVEGQKVSNSVPLIHAAAMVPWVNWLRKQGRPVQARLEAADLGFLPVDQPNRVIPLLNAVEFVRQQSRIEGPDLACRVVSTEDVWDLGNLGLVMLDARTPRESFGRIERALSRHSSHEVIHVEETATGILIRESWLCAFDPEALHTIQIYVASIIASVVRLTGQRDHIFEMMRVVSHPEAGLAHLRPWFGAAVEATSRQAIEVEIARSVADAEFDLARYGPAPSSPPSFDQWTRLPNSNRASDAVILVIAAMLGSGQVGIARVAAASGMSERTLQRQLSEEGTDFSTLFEEARKARAVALLKDGSMSIADVAAALGYANPPAFTRAFRRWTGLTPIAFAKRNRESN